MPQPVNVSLRRHELIIVAAPDSKLSLCTRTEVVREQYDKEMVFFFLEHFRRERNIANDVIDLLWSPDESPDVFGPKRSSEVT